MSTDDRPRPRATLPLVRCAVYTRKSTEEGLEQEFNSLDAQREPGRAGSERLGTRVESRCARPGRRSRAWATQ
jgi:hypothetical protein